MSSHVESFKGIMNPLSTIGDPIPRARLVTHLLDMVKGPSYKNIITIQSNKDGIEFQNTCISLLGYSQCHDCQMLVTHEAAWIAQGYYTELEIAFTIQRHPF